MAKKERYLFLATLFSVVFLMTMISAAITINTPTSGQVVNGTFVFNVTTSQAQAVNCTFSTTADSIFAVSTNNTDDQTEFINSTDTSILTDAASTTLTVACTNSTNDEETQTSTFDIDNTAPVCSFLIDREFVRFQDGIGVQTTQTSTDTTALTYAWTLSRDGTTTATSTSASPLFLDGDFDQIDEFDLGLVVTDEVSKSTTCSDQIINVQGSKKGTPAIAATFIADNKGKIGLGFGIFFVVILLVGGFFLVNKGK